MAFKPDMVDVVKMAPPVDQPTAAPPVHSIQLNAALLDRLSMMQVHDLAQAPEVSQVTTTDSDLHVHFEYCLVTITRKLAGTPWWHTDFVAEDDIAEDRTFHELHAPPARPLFFLKNFRAGDVRRHQVRRELNPFEVERQQLRNIGNHQRLRQTGHAFQ